MLTLQVNWEENFKKQHLGALKHTNGQERHDIMALTSTVNARIKAIRQMIAMGQAIYKD